MQKCRFIPAFIFLIALPARSETCIPLLNDRSHPLLIAHRGASGHRPEHTLAGYQLAMEMGADFIEPDLVTTRDGVLIARHEPNILETTDVASHPEFAARRTIKMIDGEAVDGFFTEDFTLTEIKTLRALQSRPYRDQSWNGKLEIPTFEEIINLVKEFERHTGRKVGLYPETKHPSYFRAVGLPLEERMLDQLITHNFIDPARVFIQSFEVSNLKDLLPVAMRKRGMSLPLIQLFDDFQRQPYDYVMQKRSETYGDLIARESLEKFVSTYAHGIGVWKNSFIKRITLPEPVDINGDGIEEATEKLTGEKLPIVVNAHAARLLVHVYTMRDEERFQAQGYPTPSQEYLDLTCMGVDGFFADFPDTAFKTLTSGFVPML